MVIIALVMGLVATSLSRSVSGAESRAAARKAVAAIRYTRTQAILKKTEQVFLVDVEARSYQAPGRPVVIARNAERTMAGNRWASSIDPFHFVSGRKSAV